VYFYSNDIHRNISVLVSSTLKKVSPDSFEMLVPNKLHGFTPNR
jgi:hypothetical protein